MDGQKIFVSTVGDDSGDGSEEEPLRTLEKAIDVANEMREDSDKLIEILLREGTYSVTNTIKIINSQKDDSLLKISAYQDEKVTINAGVDIPLSAMNIADSDFTNAIIDKPNAGSVLQYNLKDAQIEDFGEISLRGHLISDEKANGGKITVEVQQSDSTTGITSAAEGICDIGMASRELKDEETSENLTATEIARDGIAVVVNNDNDIDDLTSDQVKAIFTGETTEWEDLAK